MSSNMPYGTWATCAWVVIYVCTLYGSVVSTQVSNSAVLLILNLTESISHLYLIYRPIKVLSYRYVTLI